SRTRRAGGGGAGRRGAAGSQATEAHPREVVAEVREARGEGPPSMRFRPGATLDPSQVEDRRGGGMLGVPGGGLTVGGGGLGLVGIVVYLLITVLSNGGLGQLGTLDGSTVSQAPPGQVLSDCQTGADANSR